ncbi:MAG: D-alanyl-D-alanine carboxypeptidase/D-alanyl-D-alanine-endopeptidase, partial [Actinomycetota bacterium]|nr:D-alanyl-D-alanine carboxypeptidase/D-alanyl-D-alanine-endopeptidase [Actinomycetota bacterium]
PHVSPARSAALALDLTSGEIVYARNAGRSLAPASTAKLPLTYALLTTLGPSFRIQTEVVGRGEQRGAVWHGDLVLIGRGDPSLSRADLALLARTVRAKGIARVTGSVVGDESWFDARRTAPGWRASFYIRQSPPLSALVVDRGRYRGVVSRSPALAAAVVFREELRRAGVPAGRATTGRAGPYGLPLAAVASPTLASLVRYMDRESDNFTAELLLKELGAVVAGEGTTTAGARVVTRELAASAVPLDGVRIVDGSGLSTLNRLTVAALVAMLEAAWADPTLRRPLLDALPVAGVNGTLEDRMRRPPARGQVLAKTGTTREASALAGYVRGRYVFAILQNGNPVSSWWARVAQDRFATVLAAS